MAAEIVIGAVGLAIQLGNCIVAPIKRQFNYLCCFNSNIQSLNEEAKKLEDARDLLQMQVDVAERNEVIVPQVNIWVTSANNEIQRKMDEIDTEIQNVQSDCLAIKSRFSLSRKAIKMTEAMKKHRDLGKFDRLSFPAPTPSTLPIPLGDTYEFHSRKHVEEEIMEALRNRKFNRMGIHGMGGVGKTNMAKRILNRAREENLFDEAVMAVVSKQVDMLKIQLAIANSLGLNLGAETLSAGANKLHARLTGKYRVLVVLDDVWEKLKLEDLGIPSQSGFLGCTILLTSRNRDVLSQMDVQKVYGVEILPEPEALWLFKKKAGNWLDNSILLSIATEVAKECKGLPIALVTVGCALKDEKRESVWKGALDQLKDPFLVDMELDVLGKNVYKALKVSYEFLESPPVKSFFLLYCLFPEDSNISLDYLTMYSVGLCMFGGIKLGQARKKVHNLIQMLKSRSLLLDGKDERHVRMHDVVRDVATIIASEEGLVDATLNSMNWSIGHSHSDCKWISVIREKGGKLPNIIGSNFGRLQLLMMHCSSSPYFKPSEVENFCFLEEMEELSVLSFEAVRSRSLPRKIQLQKNLRTLHLVNCSVETISVVGEELLGLEILCCHSCKNIRELPVEIGRLNHLKLLDFSFCSLKTIAPGIISKLVELEELKMTGSFSSWESTDDEVRGKETRKNVSLKELEPLLNLTHLAIDISDYTLAAEEIHLSSISSIEKYCIQININPGTSYNWRDHKKCMYLKLPREITLGSWICEFLSGTEALILEGNGSNNLILLQAQKCMKYLNFEACSTTKKLVDTASSIDWRTVDDIFPALEFMRLLKLKNLEEICDVTILEGSNSFKNLQVLILIELPALKHLWKSSLNQNLSISNLCSIHISNCGKLRNLLSLAIVKDALLQLEKIEIMGCEMMEQVFSNEDKEKDAGDQSHHQVIAFPKLKTLKLYGLPSLTTFCKRIQTPVLATIKIRHCPKFICLVSPSCSTGGHDNDDSNCHLFCNQKDFPVEPFLMLKYLNLENLLNLEEICDGSILEASPNYFKNLERVILEKLPALKHLWKSSPNQNVSLTNLSSIHIQECGKLRYLLSLAIVEDAFLQLKVLRIEDCEMMEEIFSIKDNKKDGGDQSHSQIITFPKLKILALLNLPSFTTLCKGIKSIEFPVLEEMEIEGCTKLTSLISSIGNNHQNSTCDLDDDSFHLFCRQKVTFGNLKYLKIQFDNINIGNMWCHQIPLDFFGGLEKLVITNCGSVRSLFSPSIAGDLVNLKVLEINNCQEIENVIADEEMLCEKPSFNRLEMLTLSDLPKLRSFCIENLVNLKVLRIKRCNEIEKVIGDEEKLCKKSPFPMLAQLELKDLSKLRSFCEWNCDLALPCLERVFIDKCPLMENFTMGSLSAPKLNRIKINGDYLEDVRDLNGSMKQLRFKANERLQISSAQESTSSYSTEGKEGEEEKQEDKCEIKEEEI